MNGSDAIIISPLPGVPLSTFVQTFALVYDCDSCCVKEPGSTLNRRFSNASRQLPPLLMAEGVHSKTELIMGALLSTLEDETRSSETSPPRCPVHTFASLI